MFTVRIPNSFVQSFDSAVLRPLSFWLPGLRQRTLHQTANHTMKVPGRFDNPSQYYAHFKQQTLDEAAHIASEAFDAMIRARAGRFPGTRNARDARGWLPIELVRDVSLLSVREFSPDGIATLYWKPSPSPSSLPAKFPKSTTYAKLSRASTVLGICFCSSGEEDTKIRKEERATKRKCSETRYIVGLCQPASGRSRLEKDGNTDERLLSRIPGNCIRTAVFVGKTKAAKDAMVSILKSIQKPCQSRILDSLVTLRRQFMLCQWAPKPQFIMELLGAPMATRTIFVEEEKAEEKSVDQLESKNENEERKVQREHDNRLSHDEEEGGAKPHQRDSAIDHKTAIEILEQSTLNPSQKRAIRTFLEPCQQKRIHLVQGPPGSGKTKTIVELLKLLIAMGTRVLVCAPSNKAVQVVCTAVRKDLGVGGPAKLKIIGVEEEIEDCLLDIFVHKLASRFKERLLAIRNKIESMLKDKDSLKRLFCTKEDVDNVIRIGHTSSCRFAAEDLKSSFTDPIQTWSLIRTEMENTSPSVFSHILRHSFDIVSRRVREFYFVFSHMKEVENKSENIPNVSLWPCERVHRFEEIVQGLVDSMDASIQELEQKLVKEQHTSARFEIESLNTADIVFSTLATAGRSILKRMEPVEVVIIDEASAALETESLLALYARPSRCLFVGDPKQLCATVSSPTAKARRFDRSLMTRLIEDCGHSYELLDTQYRMHPEISRFPRRQYYGDRLKDSLSVLNRGSDLQLHHRCLGPYSFIDVKSEKETRTLRGSVANEGEAILAISVVKFYLKMISPKEIVVIAMYSAQVKRIRSLMQRNGMRNVKVCSVDAFQGSEADVVVLSLVRSNRAKSIGFLRDSRRLNVAMTRARHALIILGNASTLSEPEETDLRLLVEDAQQRGRFFDELTLRKQVSLHCEAKKL